MWSLILYVVCSMYVVCVCMYVVICKIDHCIHIHWCIVMGLGHNDPWVESHMWPQQTWGQRSSRGQWPLVQVFGKKGQCIHILWCIFKSIKYYNDCKSMWSRKQARLVVREPPCLFLFLFFFPTVYVRLYIEKGAKNSKIWKKGMFFSPWNCDICLLFRV